MKGSVWWQGGSLPPTPPITPPTIPVPTSHNPQRPPRATVCATFCTATPLAAPASPVGGGRHSCTGSLAIVPYPVRDAIHAQPYSLKASLPPHPPRSPTRSPPRSPPLSWHRLSHRLKPITQLMSVSTSTLAVI
ncbi:hypothetical protein E2C01_017849 [Portunus trituberculatus]|uniref:Uncharacterized protein n=1 Tax=Portunus trituberculatus TaxID=210409 RepID=A0A5B7DTY7_PORTR|nr:hypothetical protein [Portunus trituberculatus]